MVIRDVFYFSLDLVFLLDFMRKRINVKLFLLRRLLYQSFLVQQFQRQKDLLDTK